MRLTPTPQTGDGEKRSVLPPRPAKTRFQMFLNSFLIFLTFLRPKNANLANFFQLGILLSPKNQNFAKFFFSSRIFGKLPRLGFFAQKTNFPLFPTTAISIKKDLKFLLAPPKATPKNGVFQECRPKNPYCCKEIRKAKGHKKPRFFSKKAGFPVGEQFATSFQKSATHFWMQ